MAPEEEKAAGEETASEWETSVEETAAKWETAAEGETVTVEGETATE